ncbi:hypothetical protein [Subtercola endophyticus]|uniref:hypothetical protein n=1 Tax=Subtercola endophyticus TaxID=2895559 RepID=UPI001E3C11D9|nr:hypothetical protein [Subtercola endophyticus]UFS57893.1 hypothetical protein LQ955_12700 [Subtercola endophyticus]
MSVSSKLPRRRSDGAPRRARPNAVRLVSLAAAGLLIAAAPLGLAASAQASTSASTSTSTPAQAGSSASALAAADAPGTLSFPATTTIPADGTAVFVNLDVPAGLTPTSVTGIVAPVTPAAGAAASSTSAAASGALGGSVQVSVNGVVLQTLDPAAPAALNVPLTASDVVKGIVSIGLTYTVIDTTAAVCTVPSTASVELSKVVLAYSGDATVPKTVAEFLNPSLTAVAVQIPDAPSSALEQAGLSTVAALAHALPSGVDISLTTAGDSANEAAVDPIRGRIIVLAPSTDSSVTTATTALSTGAGGVPTLTISGPEASLSAAGTALGSDYLVLANSGNTTGLSQTGTSTPALTQNLQYFGSPSQIALAGFGQTSSFTNISQASFGGPISSATVNLVGMHSDIPDSVIATANVYWNNFLIGSQVLGHSTTFSMTLPVSGTLITAANGLKIQLSAVPVTGNCTGAPALIPIQLFVDAAASNVSAVRGQTINPGFQRFPQVLGGVLPVAFDSGASVDVAVASAGDIVASLQRNSSIQLAVTVMTPGEFVSSSKSGLFVGATSDDSNALGAPLRLDSFKAIDSNAVSFGVGTTEPYATLQAFQSGGRNVLMLGGWSPSSSAGDVDALQLQAAEYTMSNPDQWFGLSGDILVAQPNQADPVLISSNAIVPQTAVTDDYRGYAVWIAVVAIVLILAGVIGEITRRRRRGKLKKYVDAQLVAEGTAQSQAAAESTGTAPTGTTGTAPTGTGTTGTGPTPPPSTD